MTVPEPAPARADRPAHLRVVRSRADLDLSAAERAVADLLRALGRDPAEPHLADTPRRLFARDLQVQERLTQQVADWLQDNLAPRGVGVVVEAEHLCMSLRGVRARGTRTTTSALHGALRDDARSRQEFFALTGLRG
jgi:GTP cyclohydrolase I